MNDSDRAQLAAGNAKIGAILAAKGLAPEQAAAVMRDQIQPALDDAAQRVEDGADINEIEFVVRTRQS